MTTPSTATEMDEGYTEIEHTADWAIEVWAPDFEGVVREATRGMYELAGVELDASRGDREILEITGDDRVDVLVAWLSELVFFWSARDQGIAEPEVDFDGRTLSATGRLAPIVAQQKEVKAVTYHGLEVRETQRGIEATVTFDV